MRVQRTHSLSEHICPLTTTDILEITTSSEFAECSYPALNTRTIAKRHESLYKTFFTYYSATERCHENGQWCYT